MKTTHANKHLFKSLLLLATLTSTGAFAQDLGQMASDMNNLANIFGGIGQAAAGADALGCFINSLGAQPVSWAALLTVAGLASSLFLRRKD
jgi:hypothetical protein